MEPTIDPGLAAAFIQAQGQLRSAIKDSINPHLKSKYADLTSIWEACREALQANGLGVFQSYAPTEGGVCVSTLIFHASGAALPKSECFIPVERLKQHTTYQGGSRSPVFLADGTPQMVPMDNLAHAYGSAGTYARRYGLAAALGVITEDDDGHAAGYKPASTARAQTNGAGEPWRKLYARVKDHPELQAGLKALWAEDFPGTPMPKLREMSPDALAWVERAIPEVRS